jgi:phage repressor protein C with HTH and peptisase S24 domain
METPSDLKGRLLMAMGQDFSKTDLARACGISTAAVAKWFREDAPTTNLKSDNLLAVAKLLGVRPEWLIHGAVAAGKRSPLDTGRYVLVPRVRVEIAAGEGRVVDVEDEGHPLPFEANFIRRIGGSVRSLRLLKVRGNSMAPYINDGDTVMIDITARELVDGEVYAIRYDDEIRLKRLFRRVDGGLTIRSDNTTEYPDEVVAPERVEAVHIIGRSVWRAG